jgi:hypothetical protein
MTTVIIPSRQITANFPQQITKGVSIDDYTIQGLGIFLDLDGIRKCNTTENADVVVFDTNPSAYRSAELHGVSVTNETRQQNMQVWLETWLDMERFVGIETLDEFIRQMEYGWKSSADKSTSSDVFSYTNTDPMSIIDDIVFSHTPNTDKHEGSVLLKVTFRPMPLHVVMRKCCDILDTISKKCRTVTSDTLAMVFIPNQMISMCTKFPRRVVIDRVASNAEINNRSMNSRAMNNQGMNSRTMNMNNNWGSNRNNSYTNSNSYINSNSGDVPHFSSLRPRVESMLYNVSRQY